MLIITPLGSFTNARVVERFGASTMMVFGYVIMITAGVVLLITGLWFHVNIYSVLVAMALMYFGVCFIWINASSGAMTPFGNIAGYSATLYSFIQYSGGAILGSLLAYMPDDTIFPLACAWIIIPLLALAVVKWIVVPASSRVEEL